MSFSADITRFAKRSGLKGALIQRKLGFEGFTMILERSPVREGRFRGSNRISLNGPDLSHEPPPVGASQIGATVKIGDPPTGEEQAKALRALGPLRWGDSIHATNSLPYAKRLEDGWSSQNRGPGGIYKASYVILREQVARMAAQAEREVR